MERYSVGGRCGSRHVGFESQEPLRVTALLSVAALLSLVAPVLVHAQSDKPLPVAAKLSITIIDDAQCVNYAGPDLDHQGKEICFNSNVDTLTIVDVTNKAGSAMLSRTGYSGSSYTHQGWLTEDQVYLLLGDTVQGQGKGLFSEVEPAAARTRTRASASTDATTLRRRVVTMDLERLRRARAAASVLPRPPVRTKAVSPRRGKPDAAPAPDATLTLNLFQDVVFTGIVEWTAPTFSGGYSLSGRLAGKALGTLTLVVNGETVAGTVRTLGGTYRIRSAGDGLYAISQVEEPPLDCQVLKPEAEGGRPKPPFQ